MPDRGAPGTMPMVIPGGVLDRPPAGAPAGRDREAGRLFFVVGAFDGLHRGHLYLLARLRTAAAHHQARPAVITFDHHPDEILVGAAPPVLCDPAERLVRFGRAGVDVVLIQHFDAAARMTPYGEFVAAIARRVELAGFLMTPDAAFGHERRGTPDALLELGRSMGFQVDVVPPLEIDGRPVRSTEIRSDIASGDLQAARRLLGRSVAVVGRVGPVLAGGSASAVGGGATRGPAGLVGVEFELPVALPPVGRYRVDVEPAWAPREPRSLRRVQAIGVVDGSGRVALEVRPGSSLPAADRLRIRFIVPI